MASRQELTTLPGYPDIAVERNVPCRMRDGVTLMADVYRPTEGGPFPVILIRLPYDKTQAESITYTHPSWYARHGYVVVVQDNRGRWASEGEWYPFRDEAVDGYDTIEWAARLSGANGRVGMYGFSYAGATQLLPATLRPPSLVTICPAFTSSQYYDGWTYRGGALQLAFVASWATDLAAGTARRRHDDAALTELLAALRGAAGWFWSLPLAEYPPLVGEYAPYFFDWLAHPTDDDYWQRWSIEKDYSRIAVPALHVGGWYDVFLTGTAKNFVGLRQEAGSEEARRGQKLLIGPWFHMPWVPPADASDGVASASVVDDWQLRWFDQMLKGRPSGVLDAPVTVFVMGEQRWRDLDAWPPSAAAPTPYYLHSGGRANSAAGDGVLSLEAPAAEPPDIFAYDPAAPSMSQGGHSCCYHHISPMGPADQEPSEKWNGVLVYTSPPLEHDLTLIGDVRVTLYAASSAVDTDWTARLCEVHPDGRSINLQEGIVRARFRDSLSDPRPSEPGRIERCEIALGPIAARIAAGHRLRLDISSSDFPQWDRNLNTGGPLGAEPLSAAVVATQTVFHDGSRPSRVELPVVDGR